MTVFIVMGMVFSCSVAIDITPSGPLVVDLDVSLSISSISTDEVTLTLEGNYNYSHFVLSQGEKEVNIAATNAAGLVLPRIDYPVTNLDPNTEYAFSLRACIGATCSTETVGTNVITRPVSAENFDYVREQDTATSLSFAWEAPAGGADYYVLYRDSDVVAERITDTQEFADGLEPGTPYTFGLVACNKNDLCSLTNNLEVTTSPDVVTGLEVVGDSDSTSITIRWGASKGSTSYVLKRGDTVIATLGGEVTQFKIDELEPETEYTFLLEACNDTGCSDPATVTENTAESIPNSPVGLNYTKVTSTAVGLGWDAVNKATAYRVVYTDITGGGSEVSNQVDLSEFATTVVLTANTEYTFSVKACNSQGCSEASSLTLTTAPVAPADLETGTTTISTIPLTWTASPGATHYVIHTGSTKVTNIGSSYTTSNLDSGTPYTFKIQACNAFGCSDESMVVGITIPDAVKNLTHESVASTTVTLKWDEVTGAKSYIVYQGGNAIATNSGVTPATTYTVSGLDANTEYTFSVSACVGDDSKLCSTKTDHTLITAPVAPQELTVVGITPTSVDLSWSAVVGADEYVVYQGNDPVATNTETTYTAGNLVTETPYTFKIQACNAFGCSDESMVVGITIPDAVKNLTHESVASTTVTLKWDEVTGAKSYIVYQGGNAIATNSGVTPATTYTVSGLDANTEYTFSVSACVGDDSKLCSTKTDHTLITAPVAPQELTVVGITPTSVDLSWSAVAGSDEYVVYRGNDPVATNTETTYTAGNLVTETPYTFKIQACNAFGCSDESMVVGITIPDAVKNLTHESVASTTVTLKWDEVTGAKSYIVYQGGNAIATNSGVTPATTYTVSGLDSNTEYTFSVSACVGDDSRLCSTKTDHTLITAPVAPQGLTVVGITPTSVDLIWSAVVGADEYVVYQGNDPVATNTETTYTAGTLVAETPYTFRVSACNAFGCSDTLASVNFTTSGYFKISYPNMASEVSSTSSPVIVSGYGCDFQAFTTAGIVNYSISTIPGSTALILPTIAAKTGVVVNNGNATPGAYKVTVEVVGNVGCSTNVLVYNTITPAGLTALKAHLFGDSSGVSLHGNAGNYNYIDTSKITSLNKLFDGKTTFNGNISEWDTSKVTDMRDIFKGAYAFNQPLNNWDTSKVQYMGSMFYQARAFNQPIGAWETSNVTQMSSMFWGASKFNQPLSNWNTSRVQYMNHMFASASKFNQSLSNWDTSQVRDMNNMFSSASVFNKPLNSWNVLNVVNMRGMFANAIAFNQSLNQWNPLRVIDMSYMFYLTKQFNRNLSGWNVDSVTSHDSVFQGSAMQGKTSQYPDPTWTP